MPSLSFLITGIGGAAITIIASALSQDIWIGLLYGSPILVAFLTLAMGDALSRWQSGSWVEIAPDLARTHPLYGIGGWLAFMFVCLMLAVIVYPVRLLLAEYAAYMNAMVEGLRSVSPHLSLAEARALAWTYLWKPPVVHGAVHVLMIAALGTAGYVWLVRLCFTHSRFFRAAYVAVGLGLVVMFLVEMLAVSQVYGYDPSMLVNTIPAAAGGLLGTAVWGTYLYRSRRVNVTMHHRVRARDPLAEKAQEKAETEADDMEPSSGSKPMFRAKRVETPAEPAAPVAPVAPAAPEAPVAAAPAATGADRAASAVADRLATVKELYARGLISDDEFAEKRREILNGI